MRPSEADKRFVAFLKGLVDRDDRAALARLRRGFEGSPSSFLSMSPYVAGFIRKIASQWEEDCYYVVAGLFAWHQNDWEGAEEGGRNLGDSFARMASQERLRTGRDTNIETRFVALLNSHKDDLAINLRHSVSLLSSKEVSIDWAQLLADIQYWDSPGRLVQRSWAKAFWSGEETGSKISAEMSSEKLDNQLRKGDVD